MRLTDEQMQRAGDWLTAKATQLHCPACGGNDWSLNENVFLLLSPPAPEKRVQIARGIGQAQEPPQPIMSPVLTLVCGGCCYVALFEARPMGLLSPPAKEAV